MIIRLLFVGNEHDFRQLLVRRLEKEVAEAQFVFAETIEAAENQMFGDGNSFSYIIVAERMGKEDLDAVKQINSERRIFAKVYLVNPLNQAQVEALIQRLKGGS